MKRKMKHDQRIKLVGLAMLALTVFLSGWFIPAAQAQANIADQIHRNGKLPGGSAYKSLVTSKYGRTRRVTARSRVVANSSPGNMLDQVGDPPAGFGKTFWWDRKDNEILLVAFINAADDLGICIDNIAPNDVVEITSASGISSFSEDKGNPAVSGIIALIAVGAEVYAPEAAPLIEAGEQFARDQFKATNAKTKRRDAFGVDPGSGHKAREEGGVLVALPEAGGPYYSGDDDHTSRWIKPDGTRTPDHLPKHIPIGTAFFLRQGSRSNNTSRVSINGQIYLVAWDWKFTDNAGYYKVFVHIKKGGPPQPPTE